MNNPEKIRLKYNGLWTVAIRWPYCKRFLNPGDEFETSREAYETERKNEKIPGTDKPLYTEIILKEIPDQKSVEMKKELKKATEQVITGLNPENNLEG